MSYLFLQYYLNNHTLDKQQLYFSLMAIAQNYFVESMKLTLGDDSHWYGVKFEKALPFLMEKLK